MKNKICMFKNCGRPHNCKGYCVGHYAQLKNGKELSELRIRRSKNAIDIRDEHGMKQCGKCMNWKNLINYTKKSTTSDGLSSMCIECTRDYQLFDKYGISIIQYESMLQRQNGKCAICPRTPESSDKSFSVDHDHSCCSGQKSCGNCVRGLLCHYCNIGIGMLQDDVDILMNATTYIMSFRNIVMENR